MNQTDNRSTIIHYFKNCLFSLAVMILFCFNASANSNGKVSVVIPVYNVEKYVEECLDSVINQTYKDLEIICVDDCGSDNSIKIVEEYARKDQRIKIIHHDKNMGAGSARNTGVKNSDGEYIFFVDPDDCLNLNIIELMVEKRKETDADVVVSRFKTFSRENIPNMEAIFRNREYLSFSQKDLHKIGFDNFQDNLCSVFRSACGKLFKKDFLIKNNIRFINQSICTEDAGFCLKVLSNLPLVFFIENVGVNYRINPNSITTNILHRKLRADTRIMLEDFFQYLDQQFEKDKAKKLKELTTNSRLYKKFLKSSISQSLLFLIVDILDFFTY